MRLNFLLLPLSALLAVTVALPAFASNTPSEHYRWKDSAGVVHFGDTIPSAALAGGYDIVGNDGRVIRHVGRELTPEERHALAVEASHQAAARRAAQQRNLEDAQLLAAYPAEKDLREAQQGQLKQIEVDLATIQGSLQSQESSLGDLLAHAAELQHSGKPVPAFVNKRITQQRDTVNDERAVLARRRADLAATKARFAEELQRYRALREKYRTSD